jgi:hypothetical protein
MGRCQVRWRAGAKARGRAGASQQQLAGGRADSTALSSLRRPRAVGAGGCCASKSQVLGGRAVALARWRFQATVARRRTG